MLSSLGISPPWGRPAGPVSQGGETAPPEGRTTRLLTQEAPAAQVQVSPRRQTLAALVRRMQDGDGAALEQFIAETQEPAFRLAFSLLHDRHRAEDCLQDVYFTVHRTVGQVRDPLAAQTWLLRIVTHRCRKLQGHQRPDDSLEDLVEEGREPGVPDPAVERVGLQDALRRLGSQDREVLTLREMMQLSYEEIAQTLKVPLGTVRSRLAKARLRFVQALTGREGIR